MTTIAIAGIHNYGRSYIGAVRRLAARGLAQLVAVADPIPPSDGQLPAGTPAFADLAELLDAVDADVVILATPIPTHGRLAEIALRAGADVLLEKPPAASTAEFRHLEQVVAETGRSCQVGFQVMGSGTARALADLVASGGLGEISGIGAAGSRAHTAAYWNRAPWAGRRTLDGQPVVDGAITNPFSHAVVTALLVDGSLQYDDVDTVDLELHRANPIECDDTSALRIRTSRGTRVVGAFTLCGEQNGNGCIVVRGSGGTAVLDYITDTLTIDGIEQRRRDRADLLDNLIAHRDDPEVPLIAELSSTGAFMRVLEAVRRMPGPAVIDADLVRWHRDPAAPGNDHPVVLGVEHWVRRCADELAMFSELGAPWSAVRN